MGAWLTWLQRLQQIYSSGLTYTQNPFDRERFEMLRALTAEIAAAHSNDAAETFEKVLAAEKGYATPKVDVRAVVLDAHGRVLLVRESADGCWSLPGGWADVGASPSEAVVQEVEQEAGLQARAVRLLAVHENSRRHPPPRLWSVYKLFLQCEVTGGSLRPGLPETTDARFFAPGEIPQALSERRVTRQQLDEMLGLCANPTAPTRFD